MKYPGGKVMKKNEKEDVFRSLNENIRTKILKVEEDLQEIKEEVDTLKKDHIRYRSPTTAFSGGGWRSQEENRVIGLLRPRSSYKKEFVSQMETISQWSEEILKDIRGNTFEECENALENILVYAKTFNKWIEIYMPD